MKYFFTTVTLFLCIFSANAQIKPKVEYFPLADVKLLDSPFKTAQERDKEYILALDADKLLSPYLREAGLTPKAESYGNWENTGLDGHIGGHYLSALSMMYAATEDTQIKQRLDYMVSELKRCQDKVGTGYIGGVPGGLAMWKEIKEGKIDAGGFSLNGKWVPLYNIHKPFAGLIDAYIHAGNQDAKAMLIKYADWAYDLVKNLSDEQMQDMLRSEHGGLNETFADVAVITGDKKYLELAHRFSHQVILDPLLRKEDKLTGLHANTQIPKVIGFKRIADVEGNGEWNNASRFFWETVVNNRSVAIGGNSVREHFHPADNFSSMVSDREGPETCNTYNMLKLSKMLFKTEGDERYIDFYERALYNHILSTEHPEKGGFVYFTSMRPGHYRVYSQPETSMWCCVGSGLENHTKYGELIYAHSGNDLLVNLFIPSRLNWTEKGITVTQNTKFPFEETTQLVINTKKAAQFALKVRLPQWLADGGMRVEVNGKIYKTTCSDAGYIIINRKWKNGDKLDISLPMETYVEQLPDKSDFYTFLHGPIVLGVKTGTEDMKGLYADASRGGHIAHGKYIPLQEMPMIVAQPDVALSQLKAVAGKPLTFTAGDVFRSDKYKNIELVPFFTIHDSRYAVYFQQTTPEKYEEMQKQIAQAEAERLRLAAITLDQVNPGEQQPESDHFFKSEKSNTGMNQDRRWRDARGWFSYRMSTKGNKEAVLRIDYYGGDRGRRFDILADEKLVAAVTLDDSKGNGFYSVDYNIPEEIIANASDGFITIKFVAKEGSVAGGIYGVRLLRK